MHAFINIYMKFVLPKINEHRLAWFTDTNNFFTFSSSSELQLLGTDIINFSGSHAIRECARHSRSIAWEDLTVGDELLHSVIGNCWFAGGGRRNALRCILLGEYIRFYCIHNVSNVAAAFDFHRGNLLFARLPFKCPLRLSEWLWGCIRNPFWDVSQIYWKFSSHSCSHIEFIIFWGCY